MTTQNRPIANSYQVDERVYAGEYAGDLNNPQTKIDSLVDFGITHFIDLTEERELAPYSRYLPERCSHYRFPIRDVSVPVDCESVYGLMQYIDSVLANHDNKIYIHCWGGVGRTGVIVGCYYVYRGETYIHALKHLRDSFRQCPKSERRRTPETSGQEGFVRRFALFMESSGESGMSDPIGLSLRQDHTPMSGQPELLKTLRTDGLSAETGVIMGKEIRDKSRGSLIGGAIGDALGYPVEFVDSFGKIQAEYGEHGLTGYDTSYPWLDEPFRNNKALFSDDTQMTLYTAEGIIESGKGGRPLMPTICNAYIAWLGPQIGKRVRISYDSQLAKIDELNQRRAPGNTCLTALNDIRKGREPHNASKGCGGIMRIAPIGIHGATHGWILEETGKTAGEVAEHTHQHKMSTFASAIQAMIIQLCIVNQGPVTAELFKAFVGISLSRLSGMYPGNEALIEDLVRLLNKAMRLGDSQQEDWKIIEAELGGGWVAEETLAISIFSVLRHIDDFKGCMICAVNHGGDSDSTGAVAGNIIGAILGYGAIPEEFTTSLQLHDLIVEMADDLLL